MSGDMTSREEHKTCSLRACTIAARESLETEDAKQPIAKFESLQSTQVCGLHVHEVQPT